MRKAFSLIELSIVVLIIGILIAGITSSSTLVKKSRFLNAKSLTQSSPVASIKDLLLWYETSSDSSFAELEAEDGESVSTWYDINPQSVDKYNATQSTANKQPQYVNNIFNDAIPGVLFDGTNDSFVLDEITFPSAAQTSIVVFKPFTDTEDGVLLSTTSNNFGRYQTIRYQGTTPQFYTWNGIAYTATTTASTDSRMIIFRQDGSDAQFFENGTAAVSGTINNEAYKLSQIGELDVDDKIPFHGYIAEIIIFTRALKVEERQSIESYLSQKYNISI